MSNAAEHKVQMDRFEGFLQKRVTEYTAARGRNMH